MCRLLGVVAAAPAPLTRSLARELPPFTALSAEHGDGWGLAYWNARGDLVSVKEPVAARESGAYTAEVGAAHTDAALLHLRWATKGTNEPDNTHPFVRGGLAFAHNGTVVDTAALEELIDADLSASVRGSTDSERYFHAVLTALRNTDPVTALATTAARIRAASPISGLNCLLLTEDSLYVYAEHDPLSDTARENGPDYFPMWYRRSEAEIVVASSGVPEDEAAWAPIPDGHILQIRRGDLRVSLHRVNPELAVRLHAPRTAHPAAR
jgi:predicted glutamine amidotransferase